jgi:hypothetical protein
MKQFEHCHCDDDLYRETNCRNDDERKTSRQPAASATLAAGWRVNRSLV